MVGRLVEPRVCSTAGKRAVWMAESLVGRWDGYSAERLAVWRVATSAEGWVVCSVVSRAGKKDVVRAEMRVVSRAGKKVVQLAGHSAERLAGVRACSMADLSAAWMVEMMVVCSAS